MEDRDVLVYDAIIERLKTVYDPEFPLVDIFTMGLIYDIKTDEKAEKCTIVMTFTTPTCPMADILIAMVKNATLEAVSHWEVDVEISFEPMRTPDMIRDEDLKRMFL